MNDINDIADYIILKIKSEDEASLINLKLQKLLYYIQAWSYGINNKPLFAGDFQAWIHGPVNQNIYDRFKDSKYLYSEIELEDVINTNVFDVIGADDTKFIDFILENYAQFSGAELEQMTHRESPWIETRKGLKSNERCVDIIPEKSLIKYYGEKWNAINTK